MQHVGLLAVLLALIGVVQGFQMTPQTGMKTMSRSSQTPRSIVGAPYSSTPAIVAVTTAAVLQRGRRSTDRKRSLVTVQLGGEGGGPIERGTMPSYEEEQEREFFKTDLDKVSDADKVKDPIVLITLGWIFGMFLVATAFIVNGVN